MQIGLNVNPLVPLFPLQPDRQATYPRALGPTIVGNPYLRLPEAKPVVADAALLAGTGGRSTGAAGQAAEGAPSTPAKPETYGAGPPSRSGGLGSTLDLLA